MSQSPAKPAGAFWSLRNLNLRYFRCPFWYVYQSFIGKLFSRDQDTDKLDVTSMISIKRNAAIWLCQGISPRRLALTLALGFAIGCIPMVGITTAICLVVASCLRLNLPAIQAANWAAMPLQVALLVPFVRLGGRLLGFGSIHGIAIGAQFHASAFTSISSFGWMAGQAMLAWLVIAVPAVLMMTAMLTVLLRRVPAVAAAGSTH